MSSRHHPRVAALFAAGLSTGLVGTTLREGRLLLRALGGSGSGGDALVLGRNTGADPGTAALLNGALLHCADYDDTHQGGVVHPTAAVLPAALAAGQRAGADLSSVLTAYACGVESLIRLACTVPGGFHAQGFHATGVCGGYGAAVAVAVIRGWPRERVEQAARIAATYAGGTFEYINTGGNAKVVYPGLTARWGLEAVELADAGLVPPTGAVSGAFGLVRAHTGSGAREVAVVLPEELETDPRPLLLDTAIKSYPCCYYSQVFLDALADLTESQPLDAQDVAEVVCAGPKAMLAPIFEPAPERQFPNDPYEAKFALPFQVAAALVVGRVTAVTFSEACLSDPAVAAVAARVRPAPTDELGQFPESMPGRVTLTLHDGTTFKAAKAASTGAQPWTLDSPYLHQRLSQDLGADGASTLIDLLANPERPLADLVDELRTLRVDGVHGQRPDGRG